MAYPYLTMIVAMGYTRQSAALGLVFFSLYFFLTKRYILSYLTAFAALFFHKSSAIFLLFLILVTPWRKRSPFGLLMIAISLIGLFVLGYQEIFMRFYSFYVESQMESEGGTLRAIMNLIPALGFLFTKRYWNKLLNREQLKVWLVISIIVLILSSFAVLKLTFGDRLLLYFSVIQFLFFVWIEKLFREIESKGMIYFAVIMIYTAALLVWLLFAKHREAWIPYSNLVFEILK
ncbi:MAG: EpsG family protein [Fervidobacterium pennivorans]